jgi:hypothetical protein
LLTSVRNVKLLLIFFALLLAAGCSVGGEAIGDSSMSSPTLATDTDKPTLIRVVEDDSTDTSDANSGSSSGSDAEPNRESSNSNSVVILLALALIVSAGLNLFVIRWLWWRKKFRSSPAEVPELLLGQVANHHDELRENLQKFSGVIEAATKIQLEIAESTNNTTGELSSSFQVLRSTLDERDEEIKRLKEGYDLVIFRRFVIRFVRLDLALVDELADTDDANQLNDFRELLLDALDECGVTPFSPEIGGEYRTTNGIEDNPIFEPTEDLRHVGKISRVIRNGYLLENSETSEIVIPAKVAIFKKQKTEA